MEMLVSDICKILKIIISHLYQTYKKCFEALVEGMDKNRT